MLSDGFREPVGESDLVVYFPDKAGVKALEILWTGRYHQTGHVYGTGTHHDSVRFVI